MADLEIRIGAHSVESVNHLQACLEQFTANTRIQVNLRVRHEADERAALIQGALRGQFSDVTEIGTSWVADFTSMNTLRPFSSVDLLNLGKSEDFVASLWQTTQLHNDSQVWAIPWLSSPLVIIYRRDLFQQAGIDETQAFQSHASLNEAMSRLQAAGIPIPCQMPTTYMTALVHYLASWIWATGSDFCTPDGKQVRFAEPQAVKAICDYLGLLRYISPEGWNIIRDGSLDRWFERGISAMYFGSPARFPHSQMENRGFADFPGAHFVGGTNLVISRNTRHEAEALKLVQYLTSAETMVPFSLVNGSLPPRHSLLSNEVYQQDPVKRFIAQSIITGQTYRPVALWGLIEQRLAETLHRITNRYLEDQTIDLDRLIEQEIPATANRLNLSLQR